MKRFADTLLVLISAPITLPLALVVAVLVRANLGSPILFQQVRPGLNGAPFRIAKFRSMTDRRDDEGQLLPDRERLTVFGRFLRATSLDELPQLIHVLKGEMSLVGPRPLLMTYLALYTPRQARRHEVRPGIVGWAQVNGRNALSWPDRFELDVWYVDHQSLRLDLLIMWRGVWRVLRREGISQPGEATMEEFKGNPIDRLTFGPGRLLVIGGGGHGKVVADAAQEAGHWSAIEIYDDRYPELANCGPWAVAGKGEGLERSVSPEDEVMVAIGNADKRLALLDRLARGGVRVATVVHPSSTVSKHATVAPGSFIGAGSAVGPGTALGRGCIVNTNASVDHDCRLHDGVHICPGTHLAGDVTVGRTSWIGIGSAVREGLTIGDGVTVGAGAAVVADVADGETVVGVPARSAKANSGADA